jgi:hypothetical protein
VSQHVSSLVLDKLALGVLDAAAEQSARAHLEACDRCRADFEALESARRDHLAELPRHLKAVRARLPEAGRAPRWRWLVAGLVPALAALILIIAWPREPDFGIKGGASLRAFLRRDGRVISLKDGDRAHKGDEVRFVVSGAGLPWLMIASVDASGQATIYHPYNGERSAALSKDPTVEIPGSIVLDEAAGPERLFALFSKEPLAAADVKAALSSLRGAQSIRDTQKLTVAADAQSTLLLEKDPR